MTEYIVHLFREMRLDFVGIEAETPHAAAAIAADKPTDDADNIEDCDGDNLAAVVDVVGDEDHHQSTTIDFEPERLRKAATTLLAALESLADQADEDCPSDRRSRHFDDALEEAHNAIAQAKAVVSPRLPGIPDLESRLAECHQIAIVWNVEDVIEVRPNLTNEQAWEVLQAARRYHDATIGISWDVLACHADLLFDAAVEPSAES